jgi:hypothetical protein
MDLGMVMQAAKAAGDQAGAGVQLVGGLIGMYHAQNTRKAGKQKLDEIYNILRDVLPPNIELDPEKLLKAPDLILDQVKLEGPEFDAIIPQKYSMVEKYLPEAIPVINEVAPQLVQENERVKQGKMAQLDALNELRRVGRAGADDPIAQAATQRALRQANQESQSRQASVLQDAQRRGMMDSNLAVAAQLQGSSDAMERAAMLGQQASSDAYARSLQAMRDAGRAGREMSQDELSQEQMNNDTINRFNERMSARAQQVVAQNADIRNTGRLRNVNTAQDLANKNVATDYDAQKYNQGFEMDKAKFRANEMDRANNARQTDFKNRGAIQDDYLSRQDQDYRNRSGYAGVLAGAKQGQYDDVINRGKGTQQNIKGITDGAAAYAANSKYKSELGKPQQMDTSDKTLYDDENDDWGGSYA